MNEYTWEYVLKNILVVGVHDQRILETTDLQDGGENLAIVENFTSLFLQSGCLLLGLIPDLWEFF